MGFYLQCDAAKLMALQLLNIEHILLKKIKIKKITLLSFTSRTAYFGMGQGNPILIFSNRKVLLWVNFCQSQGNDFFSCKNSVLQCHKST